MNYELLWLDLEGWLQWLRSQGVESVSPVIVSDEMANLFNLADKDDQLENMAAQNGIKPAKEK